MKKKKGEDINQFSDRELETELRESQEKLFRFQYTHSTVPMKNPLQIRWLRRRIAHVKTIIRFRQLHETPSKV